MSLQGQVRIMQIITIALMMGAVLFLVTILAITDLDEINSKLKMLITLGGATGLLMYGISFMISWALSPSPITTAAPSAEQVKAASGSIMTIHIFRLAVIEGAIYLNLIVFFLEKSLISLAVVGLGMLLMASLFPTARRIVGKLEALTGITPTSHTAS